MSLVKRFLPLFRLSKPHRGKLVTSVILALISGILGLVPFLFVARVGELLLSENSTALNEEIVLLVSLALGVLVLRYIVFAVSVALSHVAAYMTMYDLQKQLIQKIQKMPLGVINSFGSSRLKQTITQDTDITHIIIGHYLHDFATGTIIPACTLLTFFLIDWKMALVTASLLPFLYWAHTKVFQNFDEESNAYAEANQKFQADLIEYLDSIKVVKVYNRDVSPKLQKDAHNHTRTMMEWIGKTAGAWGVFSVLTDASLVFILPAGLWMITAGIITPDALFFFLLLGLGYLQPLVRLSTQLGFLAKAEKSLERIEEILNAPELSKPVHAAIPTSYDITLDQISFAYESNDKQALTNVSASIPSGTLCAIVGPSGAGKSTIAQLIGRFRDVDEGAILVGGTDIRDIPSNAFYEIVSFVFQDVFLFRGTVMDNLRMARPQASKEEIIKACQYAKAHEFIENLEQGYDTPIGQRGFKLSGGQKQRLSIARALLRDTPILILDEATAYADPVNEYEIQQGLTQLMKGRTVIMIAHRLSTILHADQILVMNDGTCEASGKHHELLITSPTYQKLWQDYTSHDQSLVEVDTDMEIPQTQSLRA